MNPAESRNFALTGAAGYIAPRHLQAIRDTGNQLVAAMDPFDSVGILDSYFPDCSFFTEYERFDRHLEKLRRGPNEEQVHYLSICAPNHLHDAHIRTALRTGADAICEKPLVLNPWNLDALAELEEETGQRVWTVLQLRTHPGLIKLRERVREAYSGEKAEVTLSYITLRGAWYLRSWKGVIEKSGGVATNIGIHFFDLLIWIFGEVEGWELHHSSDRTCAGALELERARVTWLLSIDPAHLPEARHVAGERTYRSIQVDGEEVEFSGGFNDLHTEVYRRTLAGEGFGLEEARPSIAVVQKLRTGTPTGIRPTSHPFLRTPGSS